MQSAEEETEQLALEDAKDAVAIRTGTSASGPPVSYGPARRLGKDGKGQGSGQALVQVNPFWSERMQSEALLRAMRPASLGPTEESGAAGRVEPEDGGQGTFVDVQEVLRAVLTQNASLKKELQELKKRVESRESKEVKDSRPKPPTSTPPPSPPKGPPPKTPEQSFESQAWVDLGRMPEFPIGAAPMTPGPRGENWALWPGRDGRSGVPQVPGSWEAYGKGLFPGDQRQGDQGEVHLPEGIQSRAHQASSPLEQAAHTVLRQLGQGTNDGSPWMGENIRMVDLPTLTDLKEGDLGSLILGDWIQLVTPTMKDLSTNSWMWWDEVMRSAMEAYQEWLKAEPVQKLYVRPRALSVDLAGGLDLNNEAN